MEPRRARTPFAPTAVAITGQGATFAGYDLDGDGVLDEPYAASSPLVGLARSREGLRVFLGSPAARTLEWAEHTFPVFMRSGGGRMSSSSAVGLRMLAALPNRSDEGGHRLRNMPPQQGPLLPVWGSCWSRPLDAYAHKRGDPTVIRLEQLHKIYGGVHGTRAADAGCRARRSRGSGRAERRREIHHAQSRWRGSSGPPVDGAADQ